jgi:hypothetical protein
MKFVLEMDLGDRTTRTPDYVAEMLVVIGEELEEHRLEWELGDEAAARRPDGSIVYRWTVVE